MTLQDRGGHTSSLFQKGKAPTMKTLTHWRLNDAAAFSQNLGWQCHGKNPKDKGTKPQGCLDSSNVLILMGSKYSRAKSINTFKVSNLVKPLVTQ